MTYFVNRTLIEWEMVWFCALMTVAYRTEYVDLQCIGNSCMWQWITVAEGLAQCLKLFRFLFEDRICSAAKEIHIGFGESLEALRLSRYPSQSWKFIFLNIKILNISKAVSLSSAIAQACGAMSFPTTSWMPGIRRILQKGAHWGVPNTGLLMLVGYVSVSTLAVVLWIFKWILHSDAYSVKPLWRLFKC